MLLHLLYRLAASSLWIWCLFQLNPHRNDFYGGAGMVLVGLLLLNDLISIFAIISMMRWRHKIERYSGGPLYGKHTRRLYGNKYGSGRRG